MLHTTEIRVRYSETDQGGVVYHANYLVYFEVGRTEMLRGLGAPYAEMERAGIRLVVVESHVRYRSPARYDDLLRIETAVAELKRVRLSIRTSIRRAGDGGLLADGELWLAAIGADDRPRALPESMLRAFGGTP